MTYRFDGSYSGLLTAVFESFERKHFSVQLTDAEAHGLFDAPLEIVTDVQKAKRVMYGLQERVSKSAILDFYKVFLSEDIEAINVLLYIFQQVFLGNKDVMRNYGDERIMLFDRTLTKVNRERHRMKAFIRFQKSGEGMYYALIEPDFNVLPLILDFFRKRYADQPWLIYDLKRSYGMMFRDGRVVEVQLSKNDMQSLSTETSEITLDEKELHFQRLWKTYFKSTNIEARKNLKLHLQHVPRRYWKYLVEKQ